MSYNGSGTFVINSTGQPVVTGTVISSSTFNSLTADLGTGLSTAITKDGQTTTTAKIPFALGISAAVASNFAAGTVAAPSIYLSTDTGTGFYRIGANNNGYAVSGTKLLDFSSALFAVTGAATVSTTLGVTGVLTASNNTANFGTAGSGSTVVNINLEGGSGAGGGVVLNFKENGAVKQYVGTDKAISGSSSDFLIFNGAGLGFQVYTNATKRFDLKSAGTLTMSAYGVGTLTSDGSGNITSVSGEEYKRKDGVPTNPAAMLMALNPGYYFWDNQDAFNSQRQLGFYAQNVNAAIGEEAAPTPVEVLTKSTDKDGNLVTEKRTPPWGYYDRSVLAVNVLVTQSHESQIQSLLARIATLEAR